VRVLSIPERRGPAERPIAMDLDPPVLLPQISDLRIKVGVFPLRQDRSFGIDRLSAERPSPPGLAIGSLLVLGAARRPDVQDGTPLLVSIVVLLYRAIDRPQPVYP
jgi:hypothetical protein